MCTTAADLRTAWRVRGIGPYKARICPRTPRSTSSAGHGFGENLNLSVNAINVTNHRVLLDNSITIGGFHYNDPRMLSAEVAIVFTSKSCTSDPRLIQSHLEQPRHHFPRLALHHGGEGHAFSGGSGPMYTVRAPDCRAQCTKFAAG